MRATTSKRALELSIHHDPLEAERIALEANLQNTDLSLHLSSAASAASGVSDVEPDIPSRRHTAPRPAAKSKSRRGVPTWSEYEREEEEDRDVSSIEQGRHASYPDVSMNMSAAGFRSLSMDHSSFHYSHNPNVTHDNYAFPDSHDHLGSLEQTLSTAQHHASGLTLNAGLGGATRARRGGRRATNASVNSTAMDLSLSGAEYDPERPLDQVIAGIGGASRYSALGLDGSSKKSVKAQAAQAHAASFDPLILDSTLDLDRYLASGALPPTVRRPEGASSPSMPSLSRSNAPSTPSHKSHSRSHGSSEKSRPNLKETLQMQSAFSPKRTKLGATASSQQGQTSRTSYQSSTRAARDAPVRRNTSPTTDNHNNYQRDASYSATPEDDDRQDEDEYVDEPTPRAHPRVPAPIVKSATLPKAKAKSQHKATRSTPAFALQPPTPTSEEGFGFTTRANEIRREMDDLQLAQDRDREQAEPRRAQRGRTASEQHNTRGSGPPAAPAMATPALKRTLPSKNQQGSAPTPGRTVSFAVQDRSYASDPAPSFNIPGHAQNTRPNGTPYRPGGKSVHLPDMTGLTSAVASPARLTRQYRNKSGSSIQDGAEAREVEARLIGLLNNVQGKLAQLEAENSVSRRRVGELERELEACKADVVRERTRILEREESVHLGMRQDAVHDAEERYKSAVAEKKALEQLVRKLRTHLQRLTAELSAQRELLVELKAERERDREGLEAKTEEVKALRKEVERLSGEVEVLREVVEQGLEQRRAARENSRDRSDELEKLEMSADEPAADVFGGARKESEEESDGDDMELSSLASPTRSMRSTPLANSRTSRASPSFNTDAFLPSLLSHGPGDSDVEDKSDAESGVEDSLAGRSSLTRELPPDRTMTVNSRGASPVPVARALSSPRVSPRASPRASPRSSPAPIRRPAAPTPSGRRAPSPLVAPSDTESEAEHSGHEEEDAEVAAALQNSTTAPFPRIRGGALEKLFFSPSAPAHDKERCRACRSQSKKRAGAGGHVGAGGAVEPGWLKELGSEGKKEREEKEALPPQTQLVRVLRELEDDFTHFKTIYMELAEQYAAMDAASNKARRRVLADHLREVIDQLERKGDQIAGLYEILEVKAAAGA